MSDALHDLGDSLSLGLAWYFQKLSKKKGKVHYINGKEKDKFDLIFFSIDDYILCYAQSNN